MTRSGRKARIALALALASALGGIVLWRTIDRPASGPSVARPRLFWFVPDGFRADPELFDVYRWAREGQLPNIRRLMERGSYGYSRPAFPSHTPTNFATLFTGAYPEVHGVNDGPMHVEGRPLDTVSVGGFSSAAKLVEPIWVTLEKRARADVLLLCVPGSTPPELEGGTTVKGRWGGWGADFHPVVFQDRAGVADEAAHGREARLFFFGPELTRYVELRAEAPRDGLPPSASPPLLARLEAWGASIEAWVLDTADSEPGFDRIAFHLDGAGAPTVLRAGEWSGWLPVTLQWRLPSSDLSMAVPTSLRIKVIGLSSEGSLRVLVLFDQLNRHLAEPPQVAEALERALGPMVDFPDSFPPQLVRSGDDRRAFLEVAEMSLDWLRDATTYLLREGHPDVFISDTYTPNQMLTGRWWMGAIDPRSSRYRDVKDDERRRLREEVLHVYTKVDEIVGRLLDEADPGTLVVVSSDHGAIPLDRSVRLNNLLAREGLLRFVREPESGALRIDWDSTKAVYLQMCHVYVHPGGLGGPWIRGSGPEYEALRRRVMDLLTQLRDEDGRAPVARVAPWERVREEFRLLPERAGDLVVANVPGFGWSEEVTEDLAVFAVPVASGYKQAVLPGASKGMLTPFLIAGPGIRRDHYLGDEPVDMADQSPTILRALGIDPPAFIQGRVVEEAFEESGSPFR